MPNVWRRKALWYEFFDAIACVKCITSTVGPFRLSAPKQGNIYHNKKYGYCMCTMYQKYDLARYWLVQITIPVRKVPVTIVASAILHVYNVSEEWLACSDNQIAIRKQAYYNHNKKKKNCTCTVYQWYG